MKTLATLYGLSNCTNKQQPSIVFKTPCLSTGALEKPNLKKKKDLKSTYNITYVE